MKDQVQAVIEGILSGQILETFDTWYHDDVVMTENGANARVGKAANREYEQNFVENVQFHGAKTGRVVIDGDHAAVEWEFDFTPTGGDRVVQKQVALQTWQDGKIIREDFYYG